jgi:hypothetical protein
MRQIFVFLFDQMLVIEPFVFFQFLYVLCLGQKLPLIL